MEKVIKVEALLTASERVKIAGYLRYYAKTLRDHAGSTIEMRADADEAERLARRMVADMDPIDVDIDFGPKD